MRSVTSTPKPKVALVAMSTGTEEAHSNLTLSLYSGYLQRHGVPNDLLLIVLNPAKPAQQQPSMDGFYDHVRNSGYTALVFQSVVWPDMIRRLRLAGPVRVFSLIGGAAGGDGSVETLPQDLWRIVQHLRPLTGMPRHALIRAHRRVRRRGSGEGPVPSFLDPRHFTPNFRHTVVCEDPLHAPAVRVHLVSPGCPHKVPIRNNPYFARLDLPTEVRRFKGCSYCPAANGSTFISGAEYAVLLLKHLKLARAHSPSSKVFHVTHPGNAFGPLRNALRMLRPPALKDYVFQFQVRSDTFVRRRNDILNLLPCLEAHGASFRLAVLGFENFSSKELQLYNRGYGPDIHRRTLRVLHRMEDEYGRVFQWRRAVASFILFNPWTTPEDLRANLHGIEDLKLASLFREVAFRKLDLRPGVPLYHEARAEGLLAEGNGGPEDLPVNGYFAEVRWNFLNDRTRDIWKEYAEREPRVSSWERPVLLQAILERSR